jgi:hypothetical protein
VSIGRIPSKLPSEAVAASSYPALRIEKLWHLFDGKCILRSRPG